MNEILEHEGFGRLEKNFKVANLEFEHAAALRDEIEKIKEFMEGSKKIE